MLGQTRKIEYFNNRWNIIDWLGSILALILNINVLIHDHVEMGTLRFIGAGSCLLLSLKVFDWLRLFDRTAFIVALTFQTMEDIVDFAGLIIIILLCFGYPMRIIEFNYMGWIDDDFRSNSNFLQKIPSVFVEQYFLMVGELPLEAWGNLDGWDENETKNYVFANKCLLVFTTFVLQVTMLNMLIAIMSDTYSQVVSKKEVNSIKTKL